MFPPSITTFQVYLSELTFCRSRAVGSLDQASWMTGDPEAPSFSKIWSRYRCPWGSVDQWKGNGTVVET